LSHTISDSADGIPPDRESCHEDREDGGDGLVRTAEDERERADPDDLVDERCSPGQEEEQVDGYHRAAVT
jgi:hypothetical protein